MENLNKENFWNDWYRSHPEAVDLFCKWIDEYKRNIGWNDLFADLRGTIKYKPGVNHFTTKFHDIPIAMQFGILMQFFHEIYGKNEDAYRALTKGAIEEYFINLTRFLNNKNENGGENINFDKINHHEQN